jgi:hypothetical protein
VDFSKSSSKLSPGCRSLLKVDLAAEDVGERQRQLHVLAGALHRREQRRMLRVDLAADGDDARFLLEGHDLRIHHLGTVAVAADDPEEPVGVDLVLELAEEPVEREDQPVGPIGTELTRIEDGARGADDRLDQVSRELMLPQQAVEGGVPGNAGFEDRGLGRQHDIGADRGAARRRRGSGARNRGRRQQGDDRKLPEHEVSAV